MGRKPCCDKAHTNRGSWSKEEDDRLIHYIRLNGHGSWRSLPKAAGAYAQNFSFFFLLLFFCSLGYQTVDFDLGFGFFDLIGLLRCGKSCRLRWINYLRPDVKRGNFAIDEDDLIIKLHKLLGNKYEFLRIHLFSIAK